MDPQVLPTHQQDAYAVAAGDNHTAAVMTGVLDELPDSMTVHTERQTTSPPQARYRPTHPASDISALRQAVSAALAEDTNASQSRNPVLSPPQTSIAQAQTPMAQYTDLVKPHARKDAGRTHRVNPKPRQSMSGTNSSQNQLREYDPPAQF